MSFRLQARRAAPADARAIAEVHIASWQVAYRGFFPDAVLDNLSLADREAMWTSRLTTASHGLWVTGDPGRLSGFISTCPSRDADLPPPEHHEIAALYVHPDAWGAGCGRVLCEAAFAAMRLTPAQTAIVWVLTANTAARRFYERIGFRPDDARKDLTLFNVTLPELRYRQSLR